MPLLIKVQVKSDFTQIDCRNKVNDVIRKCKVCPWNLKEADEAWNAMLGSEKLDRCYSMEKITRTK